MSARVREVSRDGRHRFSKAPAGELRVLAGLGVEGDAHCGATVKHRSRVRQDPSQPNLRQVHLIAGETLDSLNAEGFDLAPGRLGENVLTEGIDLHALPCGTLLRVGEVLLALTGLRNPCSQIEKFRPGLLARVLERRPEGLVRRAGVMSVVVEGGMVREGDAIVSVLPPLPHHPLERV
ncbi:MOSC domain-containing protein [Paroceanicella profunda]|uniref:MOSC domain-containing protein n=1 Tax=Paroceanicella profunda TaxID=2579971 RepID=A0A5B8FV29_9RHOB|nr:MOSC domain-containing protein [Paroceanicella profunda]QDL92646.1 MOSC domain-containing protein [Paroceanicella profunda]